MGNNGTGNNGAGNNGAGNNGAGNNGAGNNGAGNNGNGNKGMVHDPEEILLFPHLPVDKIRQMCAEGDEVELEHGQVVFSEGEENYSFYVVLEGRIRVTKKIGKEETLLVIHEKGQFTGEISLLVGSPAMATGRAEGPTRVIRFCNRQFRRMIAECPELADPVLKAFVARTREVGAAVVQQEKLASLGKMAANLAHELNNPAAAMVRTVQLLRSAISRVSSLGMQYDFRFNAAERPVLDYMQKYVREHATDPETLSPVERSDREESMTEWLENNGLSDAWELSPGLVNAGMTAECVAGLQGKLDHGSIVCGAYLDGSGSHNQPACAGARIRLVQDFRSGTGDEAIHLHGSGAISGNRYPRRA